MNEGPIDDAAQALIDAGQALQRLAAGPFGWGPSLLTLGKYSREAGNKLVNAGEHLKRAISESPPGLSGATDKTI